MVLLTSLIAYARGIKLFLCGLGASRKTFSAGTLAHAHDDLLQWLCNTAKINKFFLKEKLEVFIMNEELLVLKFYHNEKTYLVEHIFKCDLEEYIYNFIYSEADKLRNEYCGVDIIDIKFGYLTDLKDRQYDLDNGVDEIEVLEKLIENYNYEYEHTIKEIKLRKFKVV
ncbi:hypothetical protein FOU06_13085 [Staphylococcus aureus]|nr:hypothetical protein [Staphylococcus haemolyticus]TSD68885.1 hypothetical protein FOU06_13085 [Staphylococcus aureus]